MRSRQLAQESPSTKPEKDADAKSDGAKGVEAVDRALTLLEAFLNDKPTLSLHELAAQTGFYKSTILRLAASLERFGYVRRREDNRYQLGPTCVRLGSAHEAAFNFRELLQTAIRDLAASSNETASYYIRDGKERVCMLHQSSNRAIRHHVDEGARLPLDRGAAGIVLLAFGGEKGSRFERIRREGHAVSLGERDPDAAAVSVPLFDAHDRLLGALSVSGLRTRFTPKAVAAVRASLLETAARLEHEFGRAPGH
jgi:DNA-binding IclR family transcriptional regulator